MAVAAYTEDLSDFNLAENDGTAWLEFASPWDGGGLPDEADTEAEIQGTYCSSKSVNTTGLCSMYRDYGSGVTVPTGGAFFIWVLFSFPGVLDTFANGGMRVCVGSSASAFLAWSVAGNNTDPSPYGGWRNFAVNPTIDSGAITINADSAGTFTRTSGDFLTDGFAPGHSIITTGFTNAGNNATKVISTVTATVITVTVATGMVTETGGGDEKVRMADYLVGTPTTTRQFVGAAINLLTGIAKGQPFAVDAIRYGRGEARFAGGTSPDSACTFAGFAAQNDSDAYMWGLIQATSGGYLWKGLMTLGYGAAVRFTDSNTMVMTADTRKVSAAFNKVEIRNVSSEVNWTNISFLQLTPSTSISKASLEVVDDCDVNINGCVFTDWGTFIFKAASGVLACVFRRCNTITANDANFTGTVFDAASAALNTSQLIWDVATNPSSDLTGCTFTKGALAHHAIEFGTSSPTAITLTNMTFTGFNASNNQNDSALHFKRTSGTITVTLTGTSQPSVKLEGTATVEWVTSSRTVKVAVTSVGGPVTGANVMLLAANGGPFPYDDTVTITRSGTTATVAHVGHGMATNDQILISGITDKIEDNIPHTITRTSDDAYTFTTTDSGSTSYTGTIKCTFVFLKGIADAGTNSNEISMSRSIPSTQPVTGWARKSSGAPYYKQGAISGDVVSTGDTTFSPVLIADS